MQKKALMCKLESEEPIGIRAFPAGGGHERDNSSVEGHLNVDETVPPKEAGPSCHLHIAPFEY